jgi:hypothetical protein
LYRGSLVVVQPILVSELVFIVAALGVWYSMAVGAREVIASIMAAGGLAAFLVVANPLSGTNSPGNRAWIIAMVVLIVPAATLVVSARRGPRWWRALALGAAASIGFAMTAALTKATTDALAAGVTTMLESWETYALVVLGLTSFLLMQSAFHAGPFAASQVTLILVNPLVSIGLGVALFADHVNSSAAAITAQVFALTIMVGGAVILATSSLIAGVHSEDPTSHLLAGRGRLAKYLLHREQTRRGAAP